MATISGNAKLCVGGVDAGDIVWHEIAGGIVWHEISLTPLSLPNNDPSIARPQPVTLEVEISIDPEAMPFLTDLCLQGQLGEHYKN